LYYGFEYPVVGRGLKVCTSFGWQDDCQKHTLLAASGANYEVGQSSTGVMFFILALPPLA